jgi:hypothetical protein
MKDVRAMPDSEDKYEGYYNDQQAITLKILDKLKKMGVIKKY